VTDTNGNRARQAFALIEEVESASFRAAISLFATGVTVITVNVDGQPAGMTASAVSSLSLDPVRLLVCISNRLPTHDAVARSGRFAVNVLGEGHARTAIRFATPGIDKFAGVRIEDEAGVPVLDEAIAYFICDVHERFPGGDHSIFIGDVVRLAYRPGSRPLLYFASEFGYLAAPEDLTLKSWLERGAAI
jgi:3-hydroxy-9,10-secoandrosta-1,3,5(10)-triene-9,17-dione monooxygenase reductase component